jgi:hypothetical protein
VIDLIRGGIMQRSDKARVLWDENTVLLQLGANGGLIQDSGGNSGIGVASVSSTVSCRRPVMTEAVSSFISAILPNKIK